MAQDGHQSELSRSYSAALCDYLAEPGEPGLSRARELGCYALESDLCVRDLSALHQQSVRGILNEPEQACTTAGNGADRDPGQDELAAVFFAEAISPYDSRRRDLKRANLVLR